MTQAFNLSQLANGVNTSGQLNAASYLYNQVPVANGGTGLASLTAGYIPFGAGTSAFASTSNLFWDSVNSRLGIGTSTPAVKMAISSTDAILVPVGTTAQQPAGVAGYLRFNTTKVQFEGYNGTAWAAVGGGATGGGTDQIFIQNGQNVTTNYTISSSFNAGTFGPVAVNTGVTVTVPTGSVWSIV